MTRPRTTWLAGLPQAGTFALATIAILATAAAEPPEPPPGPPGGGPPPEFRDPLRGALDANHDFELDADEIAKASEALAKLDKDGDGRISREEFRPPMGPPPGGPGRGPGERGPGERGFERPRRPGEPGRPPRESGGGPPGDRPSPERFLERAKSFDADGDGKLDESELRTMAEAMAERMRAARDARGPGDPPREGGERPARPRRPE